MRLKAIFAVVPVLLLTVLVGCGGDSKSDDAASGEKTGAANSPEVKKLHRADVRAQPEGDLRQAQRHDRHQRQGRRALPRAGPGHAERAVQPVRQLAGGGQPLGRAAAARRRDRRRARPRRRPRPDRPGLERLHDPALDRRADPQAAGEDEQRAGRRCSAVFGIAPQRWAKDPRIVGNERIAGEDTIHGTRRDRHAALLPRRREADEGADVAADHRDRRHADAWSTARRAPRSCAR